MAISYLEVFKRSCEKVYEKSRNLRELFNGESYGLGYTIFLSEDFGLDFQGEECNIQCQVYYNEYQYNFILTLSMKKEESPDGVVDFYHEARIHSPVLLDQDNEELDTYVPQKGVSALTQNTGTSVNFSINILGISGFIEQVRMIYEGNIESAVEQFYEYCEKDYKRNFVAKSLARRSHRRRW